MDNRITFTIGATLIVVMALAGVYATSLCYYLRLQSKKKEKDGKNDKVVEDDDDSQRTRQKLRSKYEIISNGLIRTGDIVAELFQNDFLTTRERDDIQQLSSTPVRANEQLLNALMLKDDRAYGCFLTALSNTDQTHIAEILNCEDKYLDNEHYLIIQRNYTTLVENLDTDCGSLLDRLYGCAALNRREMEYVIAKPTKHEKSETLLALVSKFGATNFDKFVQALEESNQEYLVSIFTGKQYVKPVSKASTSTADYSNVQYKESVVKETSQKNPEFQSNSIHEVNHEQQQQNSHQCAKKIKVKRQPIKTMECKFASLQDELQTELSLKVATLHQKTVLPSGANVEICFRKLLQGYVKQKKEIIRTQTKVEDIREIFTVEYDFPQKFKTEIHTSGPNEELLLHTSNNRHLEETLKSELAYEKQKTKGLEQQLREYQNESASLQKQIDELQKKVDDSLWMTECSDVEQDPTKPVRELQNRGNNCYVNVIADVEQYPTKSVLRPQNQCQVQQKTPKSQIRNRASRQRKLTKSPRDIKSTAVPSKIELKPSKADQDTILDTTLVQNTSDPAFQLKYKSETNEKKSTYIYAEPLTSGYKHDTSLTANEPEFRLFQGEDEGQRNNVEEDEAERHEKDRIKLQEHKKQDAEHEQREDYKKEGYEDDEGNYFAAEMGEEKEENVVENEAQVEQEEGKVVEGKTNEVENKDETNEDKEEKVVENIAQGERKEGKVAENEAQVEQEEGKVVEGKTNEVENKDETNEDKEAKVVENIAQGERKQGKVAENEAQVEQEEEKVVDGKTNEVENKDERNEDIEEKVHAVGVKTDNAEVGGIISGNTALVHHHNKKSRTKNAEKSATFVVGADLQNPGAAAIRRQPPPLESQTAKTGATTHSELAATTISAMGRFWNRIRKKDKEVDVKNYGNISDRPFKRGLHNVGNTCYFNAAMQCLISTPILKSQVDQVQSARNKEVTGEFLKFLSPIDRKNGSVSSILDPRPLLKAFYAKVARFRFSEQHNSHELLRHFLDQLRQEERASWTNGNQRHKLTAVDKVFGGHLMTVYICMKCKTPYHICEPFFDISVRICLEDSSGSEILEQRQLEESDSEKVTPYQEAVASIMERLSDTRRSVDLPLQILSITDCFQYFTRQETLGQEYMCNNCAYNPASATLELPEEINLTAATRQTLIFNPPAVLVIHLKRFEMKRPRFEKRTNMIKFEQLLDLAPYCSSWCLRNEHHERNIWYSLYGVVVHSGSLNSGHYVAYIKDRNEYTCKDLDTFLQKDYFDRDVTVDQLVEMMQELNKTRREIHSTEGLASAGIWYCMNDSRVYKVLVDEVLRQEAFLLFYERVPPV